MIPALRHTLVEGHNPQSGRFDAVRLARALGLSVPEMARVLGYTPRGLRANPDSKNLQAKLGELVGLVIRLLEELDGSLEHVRIWLHASHRPGRRAAIPGDGRGRLPGGGDPHRGHGRGHPAVKSKQKLSEALRGLALWPAQGTVYRLTSPKYMTRPLSPEGSGTAESPKGSLASGLWRGLGSRGLTG